MGQKENIIYVIGIFYKFIKTSLAAVNRVFLNQKLYLFRRKSRF